MRFLSLLTGKRLDVVTGLANIASIWTPPFRHFDPPSLLLVLRDVYAPGLGRSCIGWQKGVSEGRGNIRRTDVEFIV